MKEMGSSRRAEEIFRDYSGRRTDAVHALTNEREREVEQGFVDFSQLGLPPTSDPFSRLCRLSPPFASGRPVRGFLGGDFRFQGGERLCFVSIGPSFYLLIEAPVKHKHYRPAGKKKEGNAARYITRSQAVKQLQLVNEKQSKQITEIPPEEYKMPLVWIDLEMTGEGKIIPWSEAPYKDAAERTASGNLPLNAFLSEWALMTLLNPNRSLANLIYVGYNGSSASAIHVTGRRSVDRKRQKTERNVSCFIFGPKNAGKSPLLNSFIGRPFSKSETMATGERYAVNVVNQIGVEASTNQLADKQMPVYNLASKILCRVINVSLKAEPDTDEVFAQVTLLPKSNFSEWLSHSAILPVKMGKVCMVVTLPTELQSTSFVADQKLLYLDFAGRRFRIGRLEDKKVIIVMTGLSMLNAGISTQLLQTLFKVKAVVHYGIAGNADPQLQIGDVTIPQFWAHTGLWNWQDFINRLEAQPTMLEQKGSKHVSAEDLAA